MSVPAVAKAAIRTAHLLHGGMYARTVCVPAGVMITGARVKVSTILVLDGEALLYVGTDHPMHLAGHHVVPASAGRKQALVAIRETYMTMLFPTGVGGVEEAERAFTDEPDILLSRQDPRLNTVTITGE